MNFPNILSLSRIILLLPIIFLFENSFYYLCFTTFVAASITDYLDGYLARKNNQTSDFGALLDLLADKLFVCILLIWMTYTFKSNFLLLSSILIISVTIIKVSAFSLDFWKSRKELITAEWITSETIKYFAWNILIQNLYLVWTSYWNLQVDRYYKHYNY